LSKGKQKRAAGILRKAVTENGRGEIPKEVLANVAIINRTQEEVFKYKFRQL